MSDTLCAIGLLIAAIVVPVGFLFIADWGKGYNFLNMDDGTEDDSDSKA